MKKGTRALASGDINLHTDHSVCSLFMFVLVCIAGNCLFADKLLAADYAAKVRADNPIAYWRFEGMSGSTAAEDISGRNGTYQNIVQGQQSA